MSPQDSAVFAPLQAKYGPLAPWPDEWVPEEFDDLRVVGVRVASIGGYLIARRRLCDGPDFMFCGKVVMLGCGVVSTIDDDLRPPGAKRLFCCPRRPPTFWNMADAHWWASLTNDPLLVWAALHLRESDEKGGNYAPGQEIPLPPRHVALQRVLDYVIQPTLRD